MGQKTNPIGLRLGIIKSWESRWFSEKDYSKLLQEDIIIRKFLMKKLSSAGISKVVIERPAKLAKITIHTSRPGVIIGKKGSDIALDNETIFLFSPTAQASKIGIGNKIVGGVNAYFYTCCFYLFTNISSATTAWNESSPQPEPCTILYAIFFHPLAIDT